MFTLGSFARASEPSRDAGALFLQLCANCHEGGKGPSLLKPNLKHGHDDSDLVRSIRHGYPATGMPAFGETLSSAEIQALVVILLERNAHAVTPTQNLTIDPLLVRQSERHAYRIETIIDQGLQIPWSFVFLPEDRILLTERIGRLRLITRGVLDPEPVAGIPAVIERGEGGLMSIALHPNYANTGWIYLAFSDPGANDTAMTKIVRGRLRDHRLENIETIFSLPLENYQPGYVAFGCRMEFLGEHLFFTIGERGVVGDAQRLDVPNGKVHRVYADGSIPADNPFVNTPGAVGSIWSYGHRNPQGLAINPLTNEIWETEHGPRGGDELNYIEPTKNYGWPIITYGINYNGTPVSDLTEADGLEQPARYWTPSIATSQVAFYNGDRFPNWRSNLFLGSLAQQKLIRFEVEYGHIIHEEELLSGLGRIRDIKTGPDGFLHLALEQIGNVSGRIVRLVPVETAELGVSVESPLTEAFSVPEPPSTL